MESKEKEVLIIGGGIAGLSAGVYAQKNGYAATILEQSDEQGGAGQLTAWQRSGYTFDFCLQWLVGTRRGVYNTIWNEIGAIDRNSTDVIDHEVFVKMVDENEDDGGHGEFYVYRDIDRWEDYLKREVAPEDSKGIHELCGMIKKSVNFEEFANPPGMRSCWDYLRQICSSWRFFPVVLRCGKMTAKELLDYLGLKNRKLRYFLKVFASLDLDKDVDVTALGLIMMLGFQHDKNAGYLKGGSAQMAQRVREKFEALGGKFRSNAKVSEIIVEPGGEVDVARGVQLDSGERILADQVISACDGHTVLYGMLGGKYISPKLKKAYEEWQLFTPMVLVGFGIDKNIVSDEHHIGYCSSKQKAQIGRTAVDGYSIMNRSMYDQTLAPEGKTVLEIEFQSPWEIWENLSDEEYAKEKDDIKTRCTELLERHHPGVSEHIDVVDLATPRTTARYTGVWKGAYEGFVPAVNNIGTYLPMELDGLKNFSMAGQWVMPGGGLPPSAQSGRWVIQNLVKNDKRKFKVH